MGSQGVGPMGPLHLRDLWFSPGHGPLFACRLDYSSSFQRQHQGSRRGRKGTFLKNPSNLKLLESILCLLACFLSPFLPSPSLLTFLPTHPPFSVFQLKGIRQVLAGEGGVALVGSELMLGGSAAGRVRGQMYTHIHTCREWSR